MTDAYPTLTSMGVQNPSQIASYTVYQLRPDTDILRLRYARPRGSFLPITRKYKLGRAMKSQTVDSGSRETTLVYEISPLLLKAMKELDEIIKPKTHRQAARQQIESELERIQNEFIAEIKAVKTLVQQLE